MEGIHDPTHVFLRLRLPVPTAGRRNNGKMVPLLRHNVYKMAATFSKANRTAVAKGEEEQEPVG